MIRDLAVLHLNKTPPTAFWRSPELHRDAWQALLWLPALASVYWWTLTGLQGWIKPADKLTGGHFWHGLALVLLAGLAFLIVRLAPERLATRRLWQTAGSALGGGLVVILALPQGWNVLVLLLLLAGVLAWGAAPFHDWPRLLFGRSQRTESLMGFSFAVLEKLAQRDWRQIETDFLKALIELREIDDELATSRSQQAHWRDFLGSLAEHFSPLVGALSFQGNEQKHPELAWFKAYLPPFTPKQRARYNSAAFYRNVALENDEAKWQIRLLWLNAGLMLADRRPKTLADTQLDLHLIRLPILLDPTVNTENDQQTVANALEAVFQLAERKTLNIFQQNSWLAVLESLTELDNNVLAAAVTTLDRLYPGHRRSFAPETLTHTPERQDRLHAVLKHLAAQGEGTRVSSEPATPEAAADREQRAEQRMQVLIGEMLEAMAATNFCNEEGRYEEHMEQLLNMAAVQHIERSEPRLLAVLGELRKDIEEQGIQLGDFLPHLGRKFGALIYVLCENAPREDYVWFLEHAGHTELMLEDSATQDNLFLRLLWLVVAFHHHIARRDHPAAFGALTHYTLLLGARYPLCRLGFESALYTGLEMLARFELPAEQIETFFVLFTEMPKRYANLAVDEQEALQEFVKRSVVQFGLMDNDRLSNAQRKVLADWLVGVEDLGCGVADDTPPSVASNSAETAEPVAMIHIVEREDALADDQPGFIDTLKRHHWTVKHLGTGDWGVVCSTSMYEAAANGLTLHIEEACVYTTSFIDISMPASQKQSITEQFTRMGIRFNDGASHWDD